MEEYGKAIEIYEQVCILTSTWLYTSNLEIMCIKSFH